jgi:hypothetical protein
MGHTKNKINKIEVPWVSEKKNIKLNYLRLYIDYGFSQ